jgi:hypothetical protein
MRLLAPRRPSCASMAAAAALALGTACSDGYPTHDAERVDPRNMTAAQGLAAMNRLGAEAPRGRRWQYRLDANCTLAASPEGQAPPLRNVALLHATVTSAFDRTAGTYAVSVVPADAAASAVLVFETLQWTDATEMRSYVQALLQGCAKTPDPAAP